MSTLVVPACCVVTIMALAWVFYELFVRHKRDG